MLGPDWFDLSCYMRKPAFFACIWKKNKGPDQLHSNCTDDHCLCFHILRLAIFFACTVRFVSDQVESPKDVTQHIFKPQHLCRGAYSFRLSVRQFVCSFVRSFVLPSVAWNLRQSFALKFLKWCISQQLLIRKHSYLDHSYPGGFAVTPWPRTPGSMPRGGAIGQNLGHL